MPSPASLCLFSSFQANITFFTANICENVHPVYIAGFKPTTFRSWVSSHYHKTKAPPFFITDQFFKCLTIVIYYSRVVPKVNNNSIPPYSLSMGLRVVERPVVWHHANKKGKFQVKFDSRIKNYKIDQNVKNNMVNVILWKMIILKVDYPVVTWYTFPTT